MNTRVAKALRAVLMATTWIATCTLALAHNELATQAQQLYTNAQHSDMQPELSIAGKYPVGVRTTTITNNEHVNPFTQQIEPRKLKLEVWYPSSAKSKVHKTSYENELRSGRSFSIQANASRDVALNDSENWPLVVLSHGYTGYRTIMFYLGEHLASHGYIVVGIDHTDSTNADVDFATAPFSGFMSTLLNRSRDQQLVLNYFGEVKNSNTVFGEGTKYQANEAGVIGYSMGAFGALNTVGACYDFPSALVSSFIQSQDPAKVKGMQTVLNTCSAGQYPQAVTGSKVVSDSRWQAMMAFAPWGGQHKVFSYDSLANITVPSMLVSGNLDDISIYAGIQDIFAQFDHADHYMLTYLNARHNIAVHPAPKEAWQVEIDYGHYFEPAWSQQRLNQINQHFALAMMDCYLKQKTDKCAFLALDGNSNQVNPEGGLSAPWKGFDNRYSTGMEFMRQSTKAQ
ncbi:MAG: acetylhydrolase [Glaciecola sp.]